uniref:non-specific serine/threonine protein kinase n=1 Tax=Astyanax mexicanus TaxID=7994 RepID=A0A8B9JUI7_ASTMX
MAGLPWAFLHLHFHHYSCREDLQRVCDASSLHSWFQLLKSADLGRHSLLYLKEIGQEWFGKVMLGEVNAGLSTTQVVVKELKASASVQDQMQFLEEAQPYRTLHHPALMQCLAQCTEVTPYLLIMEYCPLGDVKGYLRSCRAADSATPDPLILQRMACEIASGLLYLHKHNYIHSDLALRNCLLSPEMTVKIGDYGLSHSRYKDDYFVTADQIWVPLRWIAPELIDEVHGNLLVVDQTKASNVWSLGVTIWELFELGNQPYRHYSDRQVLTYAVKEQQLKLPKPLLKVPLSDRWYEVMQFCWLQPEQRPVAEEVHLLLNYLCAKGTSETEEDFEKRWNSLRPSLGSSGSHRTPTASEVASSTSSFPLLEHFSTADGFQSENGDDILTVTETSHGLNFEYKWEQARAEQPYFSPSYYESDHPGVVPVLSAHSPSVSSEYYIRIEEPVECNINLEEGTLDYSPGVEASSRCCSTNDLKSPTEAQTNTYWSAAKDSKNSANDSDGSPPISLTLEPVHRETLSPLESVGQSTQYFSPSDRDRFHCEQSVLTETHLGSGNCHYTGVQESPHGVSWSLSSPSLGHCDPYLEASQRTAEKSMANETYYDMMGNLQKHVVRPHHMSIDVEAGDGLLMGAADPEDDNNLFADNEVTNWTSNHSANNNSLNADGRQSRGFHDTYLDLHHTTPSSHIQNSRPRTISTTAARDNSSTTSIPFQTLNPQSYLEATGNNSSTIDIPYADSECGSYIRLCCEDSREVESSAKFPSAQENYQIIHPAQKSKPHLHVRENPVHLPVGGYTSTSAAVSLSAETAMIQQELFTDRSTSPAQDITLRPEGPTAFNGKKISPCSKALSESVSECIHTGDSWVEPGCSSISLVDIDDCSDEDITDLTAGMFPDSPVDYAEVGEVNLAQSCDSENIIDLASSSSPSEAFSPDAYHMSIHPKSLDSGYDTENNESPEFVLKDLDGMPVLSTSVESECEMVLQMDLEDVEDVVVTPACKGKLQLTSLGERNQYRDSAYFSDYDAENDKSPCDGGSAFFDNQVEDEVFGQKPTKDTALRKTGKERGFPVTSEGSSTTQEATAMEDQANGSTKDFSSAESLGSDSTIVEVKRDSSLDNILPALPEDLDIPAPLGNGEEADEDDTDDSDESDEELRSYSVQDQDEESEEEFTTVPVVVSDRSSARHLRSLLKMPTLLTQSFCDELEPKKKAVSFFDDVTVFLFDQESPTGELAEYTFPPGTEANGQAADDEQLQTQNRVSASENSTDGNASEEGGSFEWEEDFPSPSSLEPASDGISTPPNSPVKSPEEKPAPQFSRFSVSRFSITQVSDSDMDTVGGQ